MMGLISNFGAQIQLHFLNYLLSVNHRRLEPVTESYKVLLFLPQLQFSCFLSYKDHLIQWKSKRKAYAFRYTLENNNLFQKWLNQILHA